MEQAVTFRVYGVPVPQGSKNVYRGRLVEAQGKKLKDWRAEVKRVAEETYQGELITGAVELQVTFYVTLPKTVKREFPTVPADLDKLIRGVGDALSGSIYNDDSQIISISAHKRYGDPAGALITILKETA
jgi:crossover junction endodeoxyribonuclease RusA